ncbi:MAG: HlyC/CorC family transporter [Rhodospirillales bacterium]|nr:HlyC/CorC family transporter [Rhodospirillales bacterium]
MAHRGFADRLRDRLRDIFRARGAEGALRDTIEEIIEEVEEGRHSLAEIGAQERTLLRNIFKLRELTTYDVMVPRADIITVSYDVSLADLVKAMTREAHSRMPVFRDSLDDVIGFVHIKDVMQFWGGGREFKLADILRRLLFVAPSMRLLDLLLEMRKTRLHMALVVDEYGGVDGLVTIEDLVEEIVGEIEDEHDVDEGPRLVRESEETVLADARLPIGEFEQQIGPILTAEERAADIDTIGGLVVARAGRLPSRGEVIVHPAGFEFEILDADPRRLKRLKVRRVAAGVTGRRS